MKNKHFTFFLLLNILLISSCEIVYFNNPQPFEGKSTSSIPKAFQGKWGEKNDTIVINSNSIKQLSYSTTKISSSEFDNSKFWIRKGNTIYNIEDGKIKLKAPFLLQNDSIVIKSLDNSKELFIGSTIVLKKVGKHFILNILEKNNMWMPIYLDKSKNGDLFLLVLNHEKLVDIVGLKILDAIILENESKENESQNDYYYHSNLSKKDILKLIENHVFSDTLSKLTSDGRWISIFEDN